jgi:hypothetical protein
MRIGMMAEEEMVTVEPRERIQRASSIEKKSIRQIARAGAFSRHSEEGY